MQTFFSKEKFKIKSFALFRVINFRRLVFVRIKTERENETGHFEATSYEYRILDRVQLQKHAIKGT